MCSINFKIFIDGLRQYKCCHIVWWSVLVTDEARKVVKMKQPLLLLFNIFATRTGIWEEKFSGDGRKYGILWIKVQLFSAEVDSTMETSKFRFIVLIVSLNAYKQIKSYLNLLNKWDNILRLFDLKRNSLQTFLWVYNSMLFCFTSSIAITFFFFEN